MKDIRLDVYIPDDERKELEKELIDDTKFQEALDRVIEQYGKTLQELAKDE